MNKMKLEEMEKGKKYQINLEDCCIQGTIVGTFLYKNEDRNVYEYHFDFGDLEGYNHAIQVFEIST